MKLTGILTVALFLTATLFAQALHSAQTINITTGHWPPYLDRARADDGFLAQIIREAFAEEGIEAKFTFLPWSRALAMVNSRGYQASAAWSCTEARSRRYLYSEPIMPYQYVFYHRTSDGFQWASISDLKGKDIGLTQNYSYGETLKDAIERGMVSADVTTSDIANFKKLLIGRIDLFPMDPIVGEALIRNELGPYAASQLTFHPRPLREAFYHLVFSRDEEAKRLKDAFDQGLEALRANGRYRTIIEEALAVTSSPLAAAALEAKLIHWNKNSAGECE